MNDDINHQCDRDGYVLIPKVFDHTTIQSLRQLLLAEFSRKNVNVLHDAMMEYPQVYQLLQEPRLLDSLGRLLGRPFIAVPHSSVMHNGFGAFHTDTTGAELNGKTFPHDPGFRIVTVAIYLQDNNEYGGGITLVPGSHRQPDPYVDLMRHKHRQREAFKRSPVRRLLKWASRGQLYNWHAPFQKFPRQKDVPSKVGDVVLWDLRMIHRASPARVKGASGDGGKVGVFFTCGINNAITKETYMDYVFNAPGNGFLKERRSPDATLPRTSDFIVM